MKIAELKKKLIKFEELDINGIDLSALLKKSPKEATEYFASKGLKLTKTWRDLFSDIEKNVFSVAGVTKLDILQDVFDAVLNALKNGVPLTKFKEEIKSILAKRGYLPEEVNILDKKILTTPWRLNLIYRQNIQTAYMKGRKEQQLKNINNRMYAKYVGILDRSTRKTHAELQVWFEDKVVPLSHPIWKIIYPPNGFRCRCRVQTYTDAEVIKNGWTIVNNPPMDYLSSLVEDGFGVAPNVKAVPKVGKYAVSLRPVVEKLEKQLSEAKNEKH